MSISISNLELMEKIYPIIGEMVRSYRAYHSINSNLDSLPGDKEFWITLNDNCLKVVYIDFCKVFANPKDDTYWTKMFDSTNREEAQNLFFEELSARGISKSDYEKYVNDSKVFRDKFTVHTDIKNYKMEPIPLFNTAIKICDVLLSVYERMTDILFEEKACHLDRRYMDMANLTIGETTKKQ